MTVRVSAIARRTTWNRGGHPAWEIKRQPLSSLGEVARFNAGGRVASPERGALARKPPARLVSARGEPERAVRVRVIVWDWWKVAT